MLSSHSTYMTDQKTIGVDEVQAAIDLEVSVLKQAIEMIVQQVASMASHMNNTFTAQSHAIRETQEKHNALGQMVIGLVEATEAAFKSLDCLE